MQKIRVLSFLFVLLLLMGCAVEEASLPTDRQLVIASDYLSAEDSLLFRKFSQQYKIDVRIINLDARVIYSQLMEEGPQSEIDLILLESEYDVHRLAVADLLQAYPSDFDLRSSLKKYASPRYHFIGFALDPYIVTASAASNQITTYNDFTHQDFSDELSTADRINLLAPICQKLDKGKTEIWINDFVSHGRIPASDKDTILTTLPRLMKRSTYYELKENSPRNILPAMRIISSGKNGSFYNLRTFCLASQCSNYSEALTFVEYFLKQEKNDYLCTKLQLVPATHPGETFRPYKVNTGELLSFHTLVERILERFKSS